MVLCYIAVGVFGILSIFSAKYRPLFKESLDCTFRKMTFRPCRTDLETRLKAKVTGKLMRFPKIAKAWYKHFQLISMVFILLFFASMGYSAYGFYIYAKYGNCNGPHSNEFCLFNPSHTGLVHCGSEHCQENGCNCENESVGCEKPDFVACEGNCTCEPKTCKGAM
ncbi:MAG: hypothetical protein AB1571_00465 [Nanoarchaeota archaeon]